MNRAAVTATDITSIPAGQREPGRGVPIRPIDWQTSRATSSLT
jgi:hypothetical protein